MIAANLQHYGIEEELGAKINKAYEKMKIEGRLQMDFSKSELKSSWTRISRNRRIFSFF